MDRKSEKNILFLRYDIRVSILKQIVKDLLLDDGKSHLQHKKVRGVAISHAFVDIEISSYHTRGYGQKDISK